MVELNLLKQSFWLGSVAQIATKSPVVDSDRWSNERRTKTKILREDKEKKGNKNLERWWICESET